MEDMFLKKGDIVYTFAYGKYNGTMIRKGRFEYYGDGLPFDVYASLEGDEKNYNYGFIYNYDLFDNIEKAKIVLGFLKNSEKICKNCEYENLASTVCSCTNCENKINEKFPSDKCYCSLIYDKTNLKIIPLCDEYPCKYYIPKNNSDYKDFDSYIKARDFCDFNWCIDSNCKKREYQIKNKPDFMKCDYNKHHYIKDYKRRPIKIRLKIKDTFNYFESIIKYEDFCNFNFIVDGKIKFDNLYIDTGKRFKNQRNKYEIIEFNKFLNGRNIEENIKKGD